MARDGFFFYKSVLDASRKMPQAERLAFLEAVMDYALDGIEPFLTGVSEIVFTAIKPVLENERNAFLYGKKGGRGHKKTGVSENEKGGLENTKTPLSQNEKPTSINTSTSTSINTSTSKERVAVAPAAQRFVKPTIQEVASYAAKLGYTNFNAERFYGYYESNGWKVGRNPMKSWKGAVVNWHQREQEEAKPSQDYVSRTQIPDREVFKYVQGTI